VDPDLVSSVDLMPKILKTIGIPAPKHLAGRTPKPEFVLSETRPCGDEFENHTRFQRVERALFSGSWKFIWSTAGKRELYDLKADPAEARSLFTQEVKKSRELQALLNKWVQQSRSQTSDPAKLNQEEIERLKSLGYVQ
jgi:arylsulfatase A-like enzyme